MGKKHKSLAKRTEIRQTSARRSGVGTIAVTDDAIIRRINFLRLHQDDLATINGWSHVVEPAIADLVDSFYVRVMAEPETRTILLEHSSVERQRPMITRYVHSLIAGVIDDNYVKYRQHVGHVHERINLDSSYYVAMYEVIRSHLRAAVADGGATQKEYWRFADALERLLEFDIGLTVSSLADRRKEQNAVLGESIGSIATTASEMLSIAGQQSESAINQSTSVTETVSVIEEITATASQTAAKAHEVAQAVSLTESLGISGKESVDASISAMAEVRDSANDVANRIETLADDATNISEIIATVSDIAEQTNLLALNAAIEAARAGEHGRGFSVVATEIKKLADEAKQATAQVRRILGNVQVSTNQALSSAHENTKRMQATMAIVASAGETIASLAATLQDSADAVAEISATAEQQATGVSHIREAMAQVQQTAEQSRLASEQTEAAARELADLGERLRDLQI